MNISWSTHVPILLLKLLSRCLFFKCSPTILVNRGFVLKKRATFKNGGRREKTKSFESFVF